MKLISFLTIVLSACYLTIGCVGEPANSHKAKFVQEDASTTMGIDIDTSRKTSMGWLLVDPRNKWGLPKTQALNLIKKEAGMELKESEFSLSETNLYGQLVFVIEDTIVYNDLFFRCIFDIDGLNTLAISFISEEASMSDTRYIYETLCQLAVDKFNAPISYEVRPFNLGSQQDAQLDTPFGPIFMSGKVMYVLDWDHSDTRSAVAAYRNIGEGKMRTYIQLEHHRK